MKIKLLIVLFLSSISIFAQEDAWVFFNAKPNSAAFFTNPLTELTQRSLDRRTTQGIALDFKDAPIHQPYVDQVENTTGITVLAQSKWLNMVHVQGLQIDITALSVLPFVDHIQYAKHTLNPVVNPILTTGVTQKMSAYNKWQETQVNYNYGTSATQIQMLNAHVLHQNDYTGAGKIVAIMDAGFPGVNTTAPFQRLRDNGLILGGYDFVNNSNNFYTGYHHGTQVLSNMGGYADNQLVGTSPNAQYYLYITEDVNNEAPIEESNWIEAAEQADRLGVDVINTSLGYFIYDNPDYSYTYSQMTGNVSVMSRSADIAFTRGMICVTSAGNSDGSANPHIGAPADAALNVTVGSVTSAEEKSGFSSIGPAFGGRIKPDLMAMGTASVVARQDGSIGTNNGTSFASPILAGAITSFWSAFPNKTNAEIVQFVKASADRYSNPNNSYGYGIPDFQLALNTALSTVKFNVNSFNIYPNPATSEITISSQDTMMGSSIKFYNNLGQLVLEKNIDNQIQKISLQSLNSGVYYYNIASAEKTLFGKIIKN
ncbi:MAG: hypothetical protein RL494_1538 [Bacteroidota bacterium]|jgi:hypothetical protein